MRTPRLLLTLTALALVAATGTACGDADADSDSGSGGGTQVTLRVGDQKGSSLQSLLTASGQLKDLKYKINWSSFTSGPPILEAINAGSVDFGAVGNTPPIFAAAAKSKIAIIGATDISLAGQAILVPKSSTLRTVAELKGKKIAVAKGSSANGHLLAVLKKNGLSLSDVQPQFLQPADALAALTAGKVDAWATWEPYTAQAEIQLGARILVDGKGYLNGYGFLITSKGALKDAGRVTALRDFLGRYQRANLWATQHSKEWAQLWSKETGLPIAVAERAWQRRLTKAIKIDDSVVASEQQLADLFSEAKVLPGQVKIAEFVDRRFNDIEVAS